MAAELSDFDKGFNAGIAVAIEYHEKKAHAADVAARHARGIDDEDYESKWVVTLIGVMMTHRSFGNALCRMKKLTDAEAAEQDRAAQLMDR